MKDTLTLKNFEEYLRIVQDSPLARQSIILYRGQPDGDPLLPSIARKDSKEDTTEVEKKMLEELRRRSKTLINGEQFDDWDLLVYAQHFGMKTRLLDWTRNPLAALWFACYKEHKLKQDSFVYIFSDAQKYVLDKAIEKSPFNRAKTRVLKPSLNNSRIIAQSGWFTAHKYSKTSGRFVDLKHNLEIRDDVTEISIPSKLKTTILNNLNIFGINYQSLYPDIEGVCKHLNWEYNF